MITYILEQDKENRWSLLLLDLNSEAVSKWTEIRFKSKQDANHFLTTNFPNALPLEKDNGCF